MIILIVNLSETIYPIDCVHCGASNETSGHEDLSVRKCFKCGEKILFKNRKRRIAKRNTEDTKSR